MDKALTVAELGDRLAEDARAALGSVISHHGLEGAVVRELTTVHASPEVVLAELERASARDGADRDLASARELLALLDKQRQRLLRLYQLGEVDEACLQKERAAIQARRSSAEATVARLSSPATSPQIPESPEDFAATCEALRERVMAEVEAGRLKEVAAAMQLSVEIEKTDDGASGVLEGVIPHRFERFEEDFSHHCTNASMRLRSCEKGCARLYLALSL